MYDNALALLPRLAEAPVRGETRTERHSP
jgi:hypothetical protein